MSAVRNERLKLTAALLNTLAAASMTAGVIAPLAAIFYGLNATPVRPWTLALGVAIWLTVGIILHLVAHLILKRLEP